MVDKCIGDVTLEDPKLSFVTMLVQEAELFGEESCYNKYNDINSTDYDQTEYKKAQFTLFAPTNEAFLKLPKDVIEAIMANATLKRNLLLG